jgi:hypothetical protein
VTVRYDILTPGAPGERYIADMTDETFAGMIGEWPEPIWKMPRERQTAEANLD